MGIFVEFISTAAIIAVMHIFFSGFFTKKEYSFGAWIAAYGIYGLLLTIISFIPSLSAVRLLYNTVAAVVLALLLFRSKPLTAIFAGISLSAILVLSEILLLAAFSFLGLDAKSLTEYDTARMICQITAPTAALLLSLLLVRITHHKREAVSMRYILMLIPGNIISILLGCEFCRITIAYESGKPWLFLLSAVVLTYLNILGVFYAEHIATAAQKQKEVEITNHLYAMQELHYEQMHRSQEDLRAFFHDAGKYMSAMRVLAAKSSAEEADALLGEVTTLINDIGVSVDTGNTIVDVIISEYKRKADEQQISFHWSISVPEEIDISAGDMYILMGNTLDNAIEACVHLDPEVRKIELKLKKVNNILFYQIRNTFSDAVTPKKDKYHGYGLRGVRKCTEKYCGNISITKDDGIYELSARLDLSQTPQG